MLRQPQEGAKRLDGCSCVLPEAQPHSQTKPIPDNLDRTLFWREKQAQLWHACSGGRAPSLPGPELANQI